MKTGPTPKKAKRATGPIKLHPHCFDFIYGKPADEVQQAPFACYSLMAVDENCGPKCPSQAERWYNVFRRYALRAKKDELGVTDLTAMLDGRDVAIGVFHSPLAMLEVPHALAEYLKAIGDKSRNTIRKAEKLGYRFGVADSKKYLDDIFEIRKSAPLRQGRPVPKYYFEYPTALTDAEGYCERHEEKFYGLFKGERLVAYMTLAFKGEIAQVVQILGHHQLLTDGIMTLLARDVVADLIATKPWIRALNFLYPQSMSKGLNHFKRSIGFHPRRTITTLEPPAVAARIMQALAPSAGPELPPVKSEPKKKRAHLDAPGEFIWQGSPQAPSDWNEPSGLHSVFRIVGASNAMRVLCIGREAAHGAAAPGGVAAAFSDFGLDPVFAAGAPPDLRSLLGASEPTTDHRRFDLICVDLPREAMMKVLTKDLQGYAAVLADGGHLVANFAFDMEGQTPVDPSAGAIGSNVRETYFRRFKSLRPAVEDIARGFKGGDFQVRGIVDRDNGRLPSRGEGWLVLKKIR